MSRTLKAHQVAPKDRPVIEEDPESGEEQEEEGEEGSVDENGEEGESGSNSSSSDDEEEVGDEGESSPDDDYDGDDEGRVFQPDHEFNLKEVSDDEDEGVVTGEEQTAAQESDHDLDDDSDGEAKDEARHVPISQVRNELAPQQTSGQTVLVDEYDYDSSDEEDLRNTIGNVPISWYDNYDHIGYDTTGRKILKPKNSGKDEVEEFLRKVEDPYFWRTVRDKFTGEQVIITDGDAEALRRIKKGQHPDPNYDPYPDFVDFFTYEKMIHPVTNRPETKASFVPSKNERRMISRLVGRIKRAWQKPKVESKSKKERFVFDQDIWDSEPDQISKRQAHRRRRYIPAPKVRLPHHRESYRPPPEFCAPDDEIAKWRQKDPEKRSFLPQQFPNLRSVPGFAPMVKERYSRCLDLYMCPRVRRMRADVKAEDLIPKLPQPKELQPFPTTMAIVYKGHEDVVRSISIEPKGEFFVSGSDDKTVKIWEIMTGRCFKTFEFEDPVTWVAYCPVAEKSVIAVASGKKVIILNPNVGQKDVSTLTDELFESSNGSATDSVASEWLSITPAETEGWEKGHRVVIKHRHEVTQVAWHAKGDYFAAVMPNGGNRSVIIHQLSKKRSQIPFSKSNGIIKCVLFHPTRPSFCVATDRAVRIYDLMKQELSKKLLTNCRTLSSMAIHPGGDNIIIGSGEHKVPWFDLDLSTKPYKMMRYHKRSVRAVDFSPKYPLFASASDDGSVIVSHGMVYSDLLQNPLIVPVKVLRGHQVVQSVGVTDCKFHPNQPWLLSCGADHTIRLYT